MDHDRSQADESRGPQYWQSTVLTTAEPSANQNWYESSWDFGKPGTRDETPVHGQYADIEQPYKRRRLLAPEDGSRAPSAVGSVSSRAPSIWPSPTNGSESPSNASAHSGYDVRSNYDASTTVYHTGNHPHHRLAEDAGSSAEVTFPGHDGSSGMSAVRFNGESTQICFGMLVFHLRTRMSADSAPKPVELRDCNVVSALDSNVKLGTLDPQMEGTLCQLLLHDDIDVQMLLVRSTQQRNTNDLLVLLYGERDYGDDIADFLDECQMFLQIPKYSDRNVPYENPQAFNPTSVMTQVQHSSVNTDVQPSDAIADLLTDLESGAALPESPTPRALKTELRPHQKQALSFMLVRERGRPRPSHELWKACEDSRWFENVISQERILGEPTDFCGGILADQMGLGKSLSTIALIASDRDHAISGPTLVVVRAALLETWAYELTVHTHSEALRYKVHHNKSRIKHEDDLEQTDVVLTTYHVLMREWKNNSSSPQFMFEKRWRRVVLDEAHDIRDDRSLKAIAICALQSDTRWALTGTPIQNRLSDMASLFKFIRMYPYDEPRRFEEQLSVLQERFGIERVRDLLKLVMLRRAIGTVELPPRQNLDVRLEFSPDEQQIYNMVKLRTNEAMHSQPQHHCFSLINKLLMICNLGTKVKVNLSANEEGWSAAIAQTYFNELAAVGQAICNTCAVDVCLLGTEATDVLPEHGNRPYISRCRQLVCGPCSQRNACCEHDPACEAFAISTTGSSLHAEHDALVADISEPPTKVLALMQDLAAHKNDEKSVVFSAWMTTLDTIEVELGRQDTPCIRIDGTVPQKERDRRLKAFRNDPGIRLVLITIGCGSVGLNLTVASRIYLMEPNWNPSMEQQALARVHRMGQKRPVTTIRYIMNGSFEEHVLLVQKRKKELTDLLMPQAGSSSAVNHLAGIEKFL